VVLEDGELVRMVVFFIKGLFDELFVGLLLFAEKLEFLFCLVALCLEATDFVLELFPGFLIALV
jgi:hypothetical protein